jgi:hypothetical protein
LVSLRAQAFRLRSRDRRLPSTGTADHRPLNPWGKVNRMKKYLLTILSLAFFWGTALLVGFAAQNDGTPSAKQDMKDAAKSSGHAAKKSAREAKKTVKKGVNKSAKKVKKGANKVQNKTDTQ